jgi:hypothetical protein
MKFSQAKPVFSPVTITFETETELKMLIAALSHNADWDAGQHRTLFGEMPTPDAEQTLWDLRERLRDCLPKG